MTNPPVTWGAWKQANGGLMSIIQFGTVEYSPWKVCDLFDNYYCRCQIKNDDTIIDDIQSAYTAHKEELDTAFKELKGGFYRSFLDIFAPLFIPTIQPKTEIISQYSITAIVERD